MRYGQAFIPTLKESPAEAQVVSHVFMIRGGYMRKAAAGVYSFLPLGWRVVSKIANIVREEMNRAGAQEILMPAAVPAELWQESGRWAKYGPELLRFKDRKGADFCIGPTHEEVVVDLVRRDVKSYRQLPQNLYQVQTKFRDELRPRAGLMRGREFIMKDAYSFHASEEDCKQTYRAMYEAYTRIFKRCGLDFRAVEADTGNIGGSLSHEFQVLAQSGEDKIVSCDQCSYAANVEQAEVRREAVVAAGAGAPAGLAPDGVSPDRADGGGDGRLKGEQAEVRREAVVAAGAGAPAGQAEVRREAVVAAGAGAVRALERVHTPGKGKIEDVAAFLKLGADQFIKSLVYLADGKPVVALVRGHHDVNEVKLRKLTGATEVVMASDTAVKEITGQPVGSVGPLGLPQGLRMVADLDVRHIADGVTGAGEADWHLRGVNAARDLAGVEYVDLRVATAGDGCPRCGKGTLSLFLGIEVGHVFYLGTKYSAPMGCTFLGEDGKDHVMEMGCYGIGVTRVAAAAIEQNHDSDGIKWPMSIAPYQVALLSLQANDKDVVAAADALYEQLRAAGIEVLFDDRDERPGAKFKDADLIGVPLRVAVGKKSLAEGKLELKGRGEKQAELIDAASAAQTIMARVRAELARLSA
jgi:prolyl-tRNA synthetase